MSTDNTGDYVIDHVYGNQVYPNSTGDWQTGWTWPTTTAPLTPNTPNVTIDIDLPSIDTDPLQELRGECLICGYEDDTVLIACDWCKQAIVAARKALMKQIVREIAEGEGNHGPSTGDSHS